MPCIGCRESMHVWNTGVDDQALLRPAATEQHELALVCQLQIHLVLGRLRQIGHAADNLRMSVLRHSLYMAGRNMFHCRRLCFSRHGQQVLTLTVGDRGGMRGSGWSNFLDWLWSWGPLTNENSWTSRCAHPLSPTSSQPIVLSIRRASSRVAWAPLSCIPAGRRLTVTCQHLVIQHQVLAVLA